MKHPLIPIVLLAVSAGCAETPSWTPGLVVTEATTKQIANPEVISNPPEGVVADYDGPTGINVLEAHRNSLGNPDNVKRVITPSASGGDD